MADHPYVYQGSPMDEYLASVAPEESRQQEENGSRNNKDRGGTAKLSMASSSYSSSDRQEVGPRHASHNEVDNNSSSSSGLRRRQHRRRSNSGSNSVRERASSSASSSSSSANASEAGSALSSSSRRSHQRGHRQHRHKHQEKHGNREERHHEHADVNNVALTSATSHRNSSIGRKTNNHHDVDDNDRGAARRPVELHHQSTQMHTARERLNLLLVSYLSAPHYSSLPAQDQESIDRETVNAFLLDERFPQHQQQQQHSQRHRQREGQSAALIHSSKNHQLQSQSQQQQLPKLVITRRGQLLFLGLCSVALLGPSWTGGGILSGNEGGAAGSGVNGALTSLSSSYYYWWPSNASFPWCWTWAGASALAKTAAPGVLLLTSLTALFARSAFNQASASSAISPAGGMATAAGGDQSVIVVMELEKLFSLCKKFIDECTRLDITLEKAFTVLKDLDQLAGLQDGGDYNEQEEDATDVDTGNTSGRRGWGEHIGDQSHEHNFAPQQDCNWQDLSSIEARLSSSHPRHSLDGAGAPKSRPTTQSRRKRRLPALDVRRAIFASLYTVQEHLERDLDILAPTSAADNITQKPDRTQGANAHSGEGVVTNDIDIDIDIDSEELVRLLDMYSCFPPTSSYAGTGRSGPFSSVAGLTTAASGSKSSASASGSTSASVFAPTSTAAGRDTPLAQHEEEEADELYRRTMARRSLSPTLYSEQQQQQQGLARFNTSTANKRRSGILQRKSLHAAHIFGEPTSSEGPDNHGHRHGQISEFAASSVPATAAEADDQPQGNRRASWAAFGVEQRQLPQHRHTPSSPSSTLPQLNTSTDRARYSMGSSIPVGSGALTPPRTRQRPQSIHFGTGHVASGGISSPLASGAIESNSTIKRERRRRSEQFFSLQSLQPNRLGEEEDPAQSALRLSTCSSASVDSTASSSASASSAAMRMSISSQGTTADPVTAASSLPNDFLAFGSPSRPGYLRQISAGSIEQNVNPAKVYKRRTRPLSMHELDFGRSLHRAQSERATSPLEDLPEMDSTTSHRNAAAAALEKRWSGVSFQSQAHIKNRDRPASLLLQSSPILTSPPAPKGRNHPSSDSPAPSFRSMRSQYATVKVASPLSKFALISLRQKSELVSTLEKALICHLLALRYSIDPMHAKSGQSGIPETLGRVLGTLAAMVDRLNAVIHTETTSLTRTMWEEFEGVAAPSTSAADTRSRFTAAQASVLLSTPMTGNAALQSTPKRRSFVACLPGSYPSSPVIEVDPATPPSDVSSRLRDRSVSEVHLQSNNSEATSPNFAPRNPFSPAEQDGRDALMQSHVQFSAALRSIATKFYLEKQDLSQYYSQPSEDQSHLLEQMENRHESLRADLQELYKLWDDGRAPIRQIRTGREGRLKTQMTQGEVDQSVNLQCEDDDEPSLVTASADMSKQASFSSVLSSGNEESISTPALSPTSQAISQPNNISDLLLDNTDPRSLPRYGLQEQLFEAYVGSESGSGKISQQGKAKLSRDERIAQEKARRELREEKPNTNSFANASPEANAELISELKDMVALLRSRNAPPPTQDA